jgi:hypothetical protein
MINKDFSLNIGHCVPEDKKVSMLFQHPCLATVQPKQKILLAIQILS